jgi:hypothetical protein
MSIATDLSTLEAFINFFGTSQLSANQAHGALNRLKAAVQRKEAGAVRALRHGAEVVELFDDATMQGDYMLDSSDCASVLNALADYYESGANAPTEAHQPNEQEQR